jgi:two-component system NtrC family sensor kinase
MKIRTLKNRILLSFLAVNLVLAVSVFCLGYGVIQKQLFQKTQQQVNRYLDSARTFYISEIENLGTRMKLVSYDGNLEEIRKVLDLDYLFRIPADQAEQSESQIVRFVMVHQKAAGGSRLVSPEEIGRMNPQLRERARIAVQDIARSEQTEQIYLVGAMAKEYAIPIRNQSGQMEAIVYGGRIINRDYSFVDKIRMLVFGEEQYKGKPVGTVTIFQGDTRISTNVLDEKGQRAIGTRVSQEVYNSVIKEGRRWHDRAMVVAHWYKSAYEPIRDIDGNIIGILYVGILEEQLMNIATRRRLHCFWQGFWRLFWPGLSPVRSPTCWRPRRNYPGENWGMKCRRRLP